MAEAYGRYAGVGRELLALRTATPVMQMGEIDPIERALQLYDAAGLEALWHLLDVAAIASPASVCAAEMAARTPNTDWFSVLPRTGLKPWPIRWLRVTIPDRRMSEGRATDKIDAFAGCIWPDGVVIAYARSTNRRSTMEQILINLIAGALGGAGVGKASPNFDLGTVGNIVSGLVGGGVLGQIATLALPAVTAAAQAGNLSIGGIISQVVAGGAGGAILTAIIGAIKNKSAA